MKTVVIEKPTKDVDGLLTELRKVGPVVSVASDPRRTYIYLDDDQEIDPSPAVKAWEDEHELHIESMNPVAPDGIPAATADQSDVHTVMIQKTKSSGEVVQDNTKLLITTPQPVPLSMSKVRLENGLASITVGPSKKIGDVLIDVSDTSGKMKSARLVVRFVSPPHEKPEAFEEKIGEVVEARDDTPPEVRHQRGVWAKIRSMLGF